jgi:hypothetical protein
MLTLLSTLISFLMGGLPKLLEFFQDRADKKHELNLAQMQIQRELELRKAGFEAQERIEHIKSEQLETESAANTKQILIGAQQAEMQAIYAHDTSLNEGTSEWMFVDVGLFAYGWSRDVPFTELAEMLWDSDTQALFASIIAFHFGGRAFGK